LELQNNFAKYGFIVLLPYMELTSGKYIYFASDIHLGYPDPDQSRSREQLFVRWLDEIKHSAEEIYLLGDIFDFWFEYRQVVPRGFTRFLGKLGELTDDGIPVHFFTGNHDIWIFDYLPKETGVTVHKNPITKTIQGQKFYIAHGDGLGKGDFSYKLLKKIFTCAPLQWLFSRLHPNFALWFGHQWSLKSRNSKDSSAFEINEGNELLINYAREVEKSDHYDYYIFGHRHVPNDMTIESGSKVIYLGDWIVHNTYGIFDGRTFTLRSFPGK